MVSVSVVASAVPGRSQRIGVLQPASVAAAARRRIRAYAVCEIMLPESQDVAAYEPCFAEVSASR
jgi:hypothetical protein